MVDGDDDRLTSWKEIAGYLKRSEKTATRWEKKHGLPVHRVGNKGSVWADRRELDRWLRSRSSSDEKVTTDEVEAGIDRGKPYWGRLRWAIIGGTLSIVAGGLFLTTRSRTPRVLSGSPEVLSLSTEA